jgi:uncharacterized repeat protein (TIGR03803 family)
MKKLFTFLSALIFIANNLQAQTELWGMTYGGGNGGGILFKTDSSGNNQQVIKTFIEYPGNNPGYSELCQASNGKLYGMTLNGGIQYYGVLFEYDPATSIFTKKIDFDGTSNGSMPFGSLIQASNGKLYGMTLQGGVNNKGVLFEFDPVSSTFIKKIDFAGTSNGSSPEGALLLASNGKLYGMTSSGGTNDYGVLFEYNPTTSTYSKKIDFDGTLKGQKPCGSLMQASNGKLYGMTSSGGTNNYGVLFEFDPASSTLTKKLDFAGTTNGKSPYGSLIQALNGKLYGMTYNGGTKDFGVLFEYNLATLNLTKKVDFNGTLNGKYPYGSLIQATNGKLYGMTQNGGSNDYGVIFEYDTSTSTCTKKLDFNGSLNGKLPHGSLMQASNGKLYGMTYQGGTMGYGVLFEYNPTTSTYSKKLDFAAILDGNQPQGSLIKASNGKLYGMTGYGGTNNYGIIFEYDPATSVFTKKIDFDGANGKNPSSSLYQASNGKLYGMTTYGGIHDDGVIFEYNIATSTCTKKLDFYNSNSNLSHPYGSLIQAINGKFYGMISNGGLGSTYGVLFEYDTSIYIVSSKLFFNGTNGKNPTGSLMKASNGKLYGMTSEGGTNGYGVLFEYNPATSSYVKKLDFAGTTNGSSPMGSLIEASNGKLYGMTMSGGAKGFGVLFEYDTVSSTYTKKLDFAGAANGKYPYGTLIETSNGKLYGMTYYGGAFDYGALFEYNYITSSFTKRIDFNGIIGTRPRGDLVSVSKACTTKITDIYPGSISKCSGDSVKFTIVATSNCPLSYQWRVNGININNAKFASYIISNIAISDTGIYTCVVSSSDENKVSNSAHLDVKPIPVVYLGKDTTISSKQSLTLKAGNGFDSYLWSNNAATNQIKVDSATFGLGKKTYWVKVTQKGCVGYDTILVTIAKYTSIDVPEANFTARIYPNPANSIVHVGLSTVKKELIIELTDINGRIVKSIKIQPNHYESSYPIDVSEFAEGLYFIHISNSKVNSVIKIVKY